MPRGSLGRLPTLSSIGKAQSVDQEEPPEFSDSEDLYYPQRDDLEDYFYEPIHADETAKALGHTFKILNPGDHVCKRSAEQGSSFSHCRQGVTFGRKYAELRQLLEARAKLRLVRDFTSRINAAAMFVRDLELVAMEEFQTWHDICHEALTGMPETKLECLSSICEDLRIHMNHWNSIKQLTHTDRWLRPNLPSLCFEMDAVRQKLFHIRDHAIWWIDRLIRIGLQVLAHCDLERLSQDALWSITRGLEDFNNIVIAVRFENLQQNISVSSFFPNNCSANVIQAATSMLNASPSTSSVVAQCPWGLSCSQAAVIMNSYRNLGESIKPIPFIRVLNILSSERSKYAAIMAHRIFTTNDEFANLTQCRLGPYTWNEPIVNGEKSQAKSQANGSTGSGTQSASTSDYHSASGSHGSHSHSALFIVGNMRVPDLSKEMSNLVEFSQREYDFASKFLHIVCSSTNLLKKATNAHQRNSAVPRESSAASTPKSNRKSKDKDRDCAVVCELEITNPSKSSDPKRKSVSWGDAAETSVKQQLTLKYMDLLWQYCGSHLYEFFHEPIWGGQDSVQGQLGHVTVCSDTVVILVVRMLQQVCLVGKDTAPLGALSSMASIARRLEASTAWAAWDTDVCASLASSSVDKCHPTPLADADYSTVTARQLRDTYQPLMHALRMLDAATVTADDNRASVNGAVSPVPRGPSLALLIPSLQRLLVTCDFAARWSHTKAYEFLSSSSIGFFLLITQSDMKILSDEVKRSLQLSQRLCNAGSHGNSQVEVQMHLQMSQLLTQINNINGHMQIVASALVKGFSLKCAEQSREFFAEAMPLGKVWRKKGVRDLPAEHQPYIQQAMETLIEPVVMGVNKLRITAQLSAISMATGAMCDAWTEYILHQKIRFSVYGAYQLQLDFAYVRAWLQRSLQSPEVQQSVLALDVFKYLDGIIGLLKRQPKGRSASRPPTARNPYSAEDTSLDGGSTSGNSGNNRLRDSHDAVVEGSNSHHPDNSQDVEEPPYRVPHMERWLALRVHGGARSWPKLPSCFTSGEP